MSEPLVIRSDDGGRTTLTLNRPGKLNALNPAVFIELRAHLDSIAHDASVGVVVLAGAGRSFCAGHDLDAIASHEPAPTPYFEPETIDALEQLPKPTICRIQGHCFTGGLELALACDLLVAAESTKLGDTHGQWGLVPVWGMSVRLPERVGRARAKELMYTSRRLSAREACGLGLVDHCVADDQLDVRIDALCKEILANSKGTNRIVKALIADGDSRSRPAALIHERLRPYGRPEDMAERMKAGGRK
ncbi:MAG: enoyl-CoA hydratase/isomerase family protein [Burkholderiaceae bacterium]